MIAPLLLKIRKKISQFRLNYLYWVIEDAAGKHGFAVVGDPGGRHPYDELYLGEKPRVRSVIYRGGVTVATSLAAKYGMAVISGTSLPKKLLAQTVRVPNFTALKIDLPSTLEAYYKGLGHSARDDIRRIRNAGYTYQISQDASWSEEFFHRYHSPAIGGRFGVAGYIMSATEIAALVRNEESKFLKIYAGSDCVGAAMFQVISGCLHILRLGWLDGDAKLFRNGIVSAMYWFCIQQAYQVNCREVNFGGTPSYLENGVLKFKAKWGALLSFSHTKLSSRYLFLNPAHPDCLAFLQNHSLILLGEDNTFSVLSSKFPGKSVLTDSLLRNVKRWYVLCDEQVENKKVSLCEELPKQLAGWYRRISDNLNLEYPDRGGRI